ncbi:MAG: DUF1573 domain-containing protein [Verrucomicrobia bacterium]|nr:DUF1573 domain-containing protein [Verrucomicrobiota bacterium]
MMGLMGLCLAGIASAVPELKWDRTVAKVEMGPRDLEAQVSYRVTNKSDATVRLNRVESSCGCTAALPEKQVLGAGESTVVTAVFEKGKRRGKNGSVLRVYLEGVAEPVAHLRLEVDILEIMTLQPEILYWNGGKRGARTVALHLDRTFADRMGAIQFDEERMKVSLVTVSAEKGFYEMTVEPLGYDVNLREKLLLQALNAAGAVVEEKSVHVFVRP